MNEIIVGERDECEWKRWIWIKEMCVNEGDKKKMLVKKMNV